MASRKQLIDKRRQELLARGYRPGIVELSLEWAVGCAEGMAGYVNKVADDDNLSNQFLPQYLTDCEKWIKSIVGEPGEAQS